MKLLKILVRDKPTKGKAGLTLIELLVVLGILALLVSLGLPISWHSYQIYSFQTEYARIVRVLMTVRSRSLANLEQHSYRLCYDPTDHQLQIVTIACDWPELVETTNLSRQVRVVNWPDWGIGFNQLSGESSQTTVIVADDAHSELMTVNDYGGINW